MMLYVDTRMYDLAPASRESSYSATDMLHAFNDVLSGSGVPMHRFRAREGETYFFSKGLVVNVFCVT